MENPALHLETASATTDLAPPKVGSPSSSPSSGRGGAVPVPVRDVVRDDEISPSPLDRALDLSLLTWAAVVWVAVVATGAALRLTQLDVWALAPEEAERAFAAYRLYTGRPDAPGEALPETAPLFLLLQSLSFFLFGATDAVARLAPALLGLALLPLAWALRPFVGRPAALGMAALLAFSPTLVYASRVADPEIAVAATSLLLVVALLRAGLPGLGEAAVRRWAVTAGVALGAMVASGPSSISVLIALAAGVAAAIAVERVPVGAAGEAADGESEAAVREAEPGAVQRTVLALRRTPGALLGIGVGFLATVLVLFTRLFSDLPAIAGLGETFADWGRLVFSGTASTPTQFFLLAMLLYEPLALVFAVVAVNRGATARPGGLGWPFFAAWFGAALLLFGFSLGREPLQAVHVALPLVLLGGAALGDLVAGLDWQDLRRGRGGLLFLAVLGLVVGLIAVGVIVARSDETGGGGQTVTQLAFVGLLVVAPLAYAAYGLVRDERAAGRASQPARIGLLVATLLLGAIVFRSTVMLNFYNADDGNEPLAQRTATGAVRPMVDRLGRLSRDATVNRTSVRDTTGGHGLVIAADERVQWPAQWYFREFPDFSVVAAGQAPAQAAEVVFAPTDEGMAEAGYTPRDYPYFNRVPAGYTDPDTGGILLDIIWPPRWLDASRYLLYRELDQPAAAETLALGLNGELTARVFPNSGPFGLFERVGTGSGRGQFNGPRGIAAAPDGDTVYVVDMGNFRVQRFTGDGEFIGIWGGGEEGAGIQFGVGPNSLGPTGIEVGEDGTVYIADTWNHRIVALDEDGNLVREIGTPGELIDQANDPARLGEDGGRFYGPRDVTIYDEEIYVTDTGNERVQVFGLDGTFRRAFGGYGEEPGRLREPVGITVGPDGLVYVADSDNGRISIFTVLGEPVDQWPVAAWQGAYVEPYLAFGSDELLYATSRVTGSVEVIGPDGATVNQIRTAGAEAFGEPVGITAAPDGTLLITDPGRQGVFRYTPPDAAAPVAGPGPGLGPNGGGQGDDIPAVIIQEEAPVEPAPGDGEAAPTSAAPPAPPGG